MIFNFAVPSVVFSQESVEIYNCGKRVGFSKGIGEYNGKIYINEADLNVLNLKKDDNIIRDYNYDTILVVYPGSSLIEVNDSTMLYANAAVMINSEVYISLDLIAMLFSDLYEVSQNKIELWIDKYYSDNFVRGSISLPEGEVAPKGGLSVEVFVTESKPTSTGVGGGSGGGGGSIIASGSFMIENPGYKGSKKPSYSNLKNLNSYLNDFETKVKKTVIIPEGYNCTDFTLYQIYGNFTNSLVGYKTEWNGCICLDTVSFNRIIDKDYDFKIETSIASVQGTVTIPQVSDEDVYFSVVAQGKESYKCDGVISAGEISADYTLCVKGNESYSMLVLFEKSKYKRVKKKDPIIALGDIQSVDFIAEYADKYDVKLKLPEDFSISEDLYATVYLQSVESPNYIVDSKEVSISAGQSATTVSLYDDMQLNNLICYYILDEKYDGLFYFGHYNSNGASFWVENAEFVDDLNNIEIELIKTKQITADISLPGNDTAPDDISINIHPVTTVYPIGKSENSVAAVSLLTENYSTEEYNAGVGGGGGGSFGGNTAAAVKLVPTISSGENEGTVTIDIPNEKGFGYTLEIDIHGGSQKYYHKMYYNAKKSTVIASNATPVTMETGSIKIELMKQYKISGTVNAVGYENSHNVINAITQKDKNIRNDIYGQEISIYAGIYGNSNYELFVPDEFDNYILQLRSNRDGDCIYYANPKATENLEESELIVINSDIDDIDFNYDGYRPILPIKTQAYDDGSLWVVNMRVIGDFGVENIMNYIALYDQNDRLISLKKSDTSVDIPAYESCETEIELSEYELNKAAYAKLFTWSDMKPVAEVFYVKEKIGNN